MTHSSGRNPSNRIEPAQAGRWALLVLLCAVTGSACKSKPAPTNISTSVAVQAPSAPASAMLGRKIVVPSGPAFAIQAGAGLGPVRFGATVQTVERLMESKCEDLTDKICRYVPAGIEFELSNGVVSGIVVHRHDRPVLNKPGKIWGRTRCAIPPDITPRMLPKYVHSVLGPPQSSEPVNGENPNRTALRESYPGLVLEYDRGEYMQELVLGSIRVTKLDSPTPK